MEKTIVRRFCDTKDCNNGDDEPNVADEKCLACGADCCNDHCQLARAAMTIDANINFAVNLQVCDQCLNRVNLNETGWPQALRQRLAKFMYEQCIGRLTDRDGEAVPWWPAPVAQPVKPTDTKMVPAAEVLGSVVPQEPTVLPDMLSEEKLQAAYEVLARTTQKTLESWGVTEIQLHEALQALRVVAMGAMTKLTGKQFEPDELVMRQVHTEQGLDMSDVLPYPNKVTHRQLWCKMTFEKIQQAHRLFGGLNHNDMVLLGVTHAQIHAVQAALGVMAVKAVHYETTGLIEPAGPEPVRPDAKQDTINVLGRAYQYATGYRQHNLVNWGVPADDAAALAVLLRMTLNRVEPSVACAWQTQGNQDPDAYQH